MTTTAASAEAVAAQQTMTTTTEAVAAAAAIPSALISEERHSRYFSRAPSSSLLDSSRLLASSYETNKFGSVDTIALQINKTDEAEFRKKICDNMKSLPPNVSWFVSKSVTEDTHPVWTIYETAVAPVGDVTPTSPIEPRSPVEPNSPSVRVVRQVTGAIEMYQSTAADSPLGLLLTDVAGSSSAPVVSRNRMIVAPFSAAAADGSSSDKRPYTTILKETGRVKPGEVESFIKACIEFQQTLSGGGAVSSDIVTVEVHQELDPSAKGLMLSILYYLKSADLSFKSSELWRRWRRSIAALLDGVPKLIVSEGVLDGRADLIKLGHVGSSRIDTTSSESDLKKPSAMSRKQTDVSGMATDGTGVVMYDSRLSEHSEYFKERHAQYTSKLSELLELPSAGSRPTSLATMAKSVASDFGIRMNSAGHWTIREYLPAVKAVSVFGEFNNWARDAHPMAKEDPSVYGEGVWFVKVTGADLHKTRVKLLVTLDDDSVVERLPPSCDVVWGADDGTKSAIGWNHNYKFQHKRPRRQCSRQEITAPRIYEAYIGLSPDIGQLGTFESFMKNVLPRVEKLGYDTVMIIGLFEHSPTTLGWHVSSPYAIMSSFGTPDELKALVDEAHRRGIAVMASVVQSHCSPDAVYGVAGHGGFIRKGAAGHLNTWDAEAYDHGDVHVCRFLMGQIERMIGDYQLDGFRFDGLSSMLYRHHCVGTNYEQGLGQFFSFDTDDESVVFTMMMNDLIHEQRSGGSDGNALLSIASEISSMPTVALSVAAGGLGFDYRSSYKTSDAWVKLLCNSDDNDMQIVPLVESVERHAPGEKTISFSENWSTNVRGRRPLLVAMFAWESLHTHAVGGVAPHVTELAAGLARLGHEIHVFVRSTGSAAAHSIHYGVHYHECPFQLNSDFVAEIQAMCDSFAWHLEQTESQLKKSFDICHAHDWLAAKAMVRAKSTGHVCVQSIHSTEFGRCGNRSYGGESKRIADIEREACHVSDRVICVSGVLASEVTSLYGVHSGKIQVVYNGINAMNFDGFEDAAPIKAKYGISPFDPVILFVGRMAVQKGPDILIEAIPHVLKFRGDVKFVIVGDGHMMSSLLERVKQLGIEGACRFTGSKGGSELKSLFKACDAVVVPSRNEPFGIVVLEAWSAYKPVIATTCGGPRDFVSPNIDGVLVDPNPASVSWGCCEILKNFEHARWMGERGRVKAAFSFSWDNIAKTTERLYLEQVNKHDSPYCEGGQGDCSLAFRLMGPAMFHHMGVFDESPAVQRGLALHKIIRLVTCGLGSDGYLNFMGSEFGHPDHVDIPREGNQSSTQHTNRRFDLPDDVQLKYKHLEFFDACLMRLAGAMKWMGSDSQFVVCKNESDKVFAFERGDCLFVVNMHPTSSYEGYEIGHSLGAGLRIILDTDEKRFGGFDHLAPGHSNKFPDLPAACGREGSVRLYLPARTAMVLCPESSWNHAHDFVVKDRILSINDVDTYITA